MTEPRIASAIAFKTPESLKELMSFLGLVNYFRDHIRKHSTHFHDMVSAANKLIVKMVTLTSEGRGTFKFLRSGECVSQTLFFKKEYKIILYTHRIMHMDRIYVKLFQRQGGERSMRNPFVSYSTAYKLDSRQSRKRRLLSTGLSEN